MSPISANDLKTRGVGAIDQALQDQTEVAVTVRGEVKYVVMSKEQYQYLRECELEAALAESKADLDAGRFVSESVAQHLNRIDTINKTPNDLAVSFYRAVHSSGSALSQASP